MLLSRRTTSMDLPASSSLSAPQAQPRPAVATTAVLHPGFRVHLVDTRT